MDAQAALDFLHSREDIASDRSGSTHVFRDMQGMEAFSFKSDPKSPHCRIIVFGRSLGGAVAVDLATRSHCH